jgi:hypothetical protein
VAKLTNGPRASTDTAALKEVDEKSKQIEFIRSMQLIETVTMLAASEVQAALVGRLSRIIGVGK